MKDLFTKTKVGTYLSQKLSYVITSLRIWDLRLSIWLVSIKLQKARLVSWNKLRVLNKTRRSGVRTKNENKLDK